MFEFTDYLTLESHYKASNTDPNRRSFYSRPRVRRRQIRCIRRCTNRWAYCGRGRQNSNTELGHNSGWRRQKSALLCRIEITIQHEKHGVFANLFLVNHDLPIPVQTADLRQGETRVSRHHVSPI